MNMKLVQSSRPRRRNIGLMMSAVWYSFIDLAMSIRWNDNNFNPYPAKLIYLIFQPLQVESRHRDTQLQVAENYYYLFNLSLKNGKSWCLDSFHFQ